MSPNFIWFLLTALTHQVTSYPKDRSEQALHILVGGHMRNDRLITTPPSQQVTKSKRKKAGSDKTLAQQVADGRYGLLHVELFGRPPPRPGLISYESNPEVPRDNSNTLGGLNVSDVWLAENHVLVLTGGTFSNDYEPSVTPAWPPIDDFKAPDRPVKLPAKPRVPPPFPVQLADGAPLQFIAPGHGEEAALPPFQNAPPPSSSSAGYPGDSAAGKSPPFLAGRPQVAIPGRGTSQEPSQDDEDDLSIYYPPPYDFKYDVDNSSVRAGPLVPGIVLPPPPNFFAPLEQPTRDLPKDNQIFNSVNSIIDKNKSYHNENEIIFPIIVPDEVSAPEPAPTPKPAPTPTPTKKVKKPVKVRPVVSNVKPIPKAKPKFIIKLTSKPISIEEPVKPAVYGYKTATSKPPPQPRRPFKLYGPPPATEGGFRPIVVTVPSTTTPLPFDYRVLDYLVRPPTTSAPPPPPPPTPQSLDSFSLHIAKLQNKLRNQQQQQQQQQQRAPRPVYQFSFQAVDYDSVTRIPSPPPTRRRQPKRRPSAITVEEYDIRPYYRQQSTPPTNLYYLADPPLYRVAPERYHQPRAAATKPGGSGSFISYRLPGDSGAHFYFITPQLLKRTDQGAAYFFHQPRR